MPRNKRDLSNTEYNSNETIVTDNNGGEVMDSNETLDETTNETVFINDSSSSSSSSARNKTYFYPKFVSIEIFM